MGYVSADIIGKSSAVKLFFYAWTCIQNAAGDLSAFTLNLKGKRTFDFSFGWVHVEIKALVTSASNIPLRAAAALMPLKTAISEGF